MTHKSKSEYDMQYAKDKLKRIPLNVQKEKYDEIKAAATAAGETVNGYIKKAIEMRLGTSLTDDSPTLPQDDP